MDQLYAEGLAARLVNQLAEGTASWILPWKPGARFMPFNPTSSRRYRGINALYLLAVTENHGYRDLRWMTRLQAEALGAQPRNDEEPAILHYRRWHRKTPRRGPETGKQLYDENGHPILQMTERPPPHISAVALFNAEQIDGLPPMEERPALAATERHAIVEAVLADSGVPIERRPGASAAYCPRRDRITLPDRSQFATTDSDDAAALHQLAHATGHRSRLARDLLHPIGSPGYAREELRTNIASLILGDQLGIGHDPGPHRSYVGHWIEILRKDPWELFRAAADAETIVAVLMRSPSKVQLREPQASASFTASERGRSAEPPPGTRLHIDVPYAERDQVKALGAKWDAGRRSWYVPRTSSLEAFSRWTRNSPASSLRDPREEFASALAAAGLELDGLPEMDGKLRRVRVEDDKRGRRSGAYVGHIEGIKPAGWYQNYRTRESQTWKSAELATLLPIAEHIRLKKAARERQLAREAAQKAIHEETVRLLHARLAEASAQPFRHPYLLSKQIKPHGALLDNSGPLAIFAGQHEPQQWSAKGNLLVTITDFEGTGLLSVLSIGPDGRKCLPRGGVLAGGMRVLGSRQDIPTTGIVVVEGFSTGATIRELIDLPVAVAFSANNLLAVARQFRQAYPDAPIYIAGDNDHWKARELDARGRPKPNVGRIAAEKAASSVAGITILPEFKPEDRGTDWNDVFVKNGPVTFLEKWRTAVLIGKVQLTRRVAKGIASAPGGRQSGAMAEQRDTSTNQSESRSARGRS